MNSCQCPYCKKNFYLKDVVIKVVPDSKPETQQKEKGAEQ